MANYIIMETNVRIGKNCIIQDNVILGLVYKEGCKPAIIGDNSVIRSGSIIYADVEIGDNFRTGHNVLVREKTGIGDNVLVGTQTIIDGHVRIGSNVSIQSGVYIPLNVEIGDNVFIGPRAVLTNDRYPIRNKSDLEGPVLKDNVSIGANSTILPGIRVNEGALVAAGSVVTKDVPPWNLAIGAPARFRPLPDDLKKRNMI